MRIHMKPTGKTAVQNFKRTAGAVIASISLVSTAVQATQTVDPFTLPTGGANLNGTTISPGAGQPVVFYGLYTATGNANESGLGVKVKYDDAKIKNVVITEVMDKCMIAPPQVQINGAASQAVFGWIDTSVRTTAVPTGAVAWPWDIDAPAGSTACLNPNTPVNGTAAIVPTAGLKMFKFSANTDAAFTSGTSVITLASDGNYSYATGAAGFTDKAFTVQGAAAPTIAFASAGSRKVHNATQIDLPISTGLGVASASTAVAAGDTTIIVEPRTGPAYSLVMTFAGANPVAATASVVACNMWNGTASVSCTTNPTVGAVTFSGLEATIPLTGVTNQSRVQLRLNLTAPAALSQDVTVGFLVGDVNNNRVVQSSDVLFIQQRLLQTPASPNFTTNGYKADVNANGTVQSSDVLAAQQRLLTRLP